MPASNFFGAIQQGLGAQNQREQRDFQRQQQFLQLDDQRKGAMFQDARAVNSFLKSGQTGQALNVLSNRLSFIEQFGGDPTDTREIADLIAAGDIKGATSLLDSVDTVGVQSGFLKDISGRGPVSVQSSKILDDGTIISVLKGGGSRVTAPSGELLTGQAAKDQVSKSRDQAHNRKIELKKLEQNIKRTQANEGLLTDQQKGIQRSNIKRMLGLSADAATRVEAIKKATKFKLAFTNGEVSSGAGRQAASFIPGVFTSQAKFDEEFDSFVEFAARQKLKASGELRPTAEDVEGAKGAFFGISRDESTNIQLLNDFLIGLGNETEEFDQLVEATKNRGLGEFIFTPSTQSAQTNADPSTSSDDELKARLGL